jgi:hypothetical protein
VLCITGNGLKTVDAVTEGIQNLPTIAPRLRDLVALVEQSSN